MTVAFSTAYPNLAALADTESTAFGRNLLTIEDAAALRGAAGILGVPAVGVRLGLSPADLQTVIDALPADVTNEITVRWQAAARVRTGDAIYNFIQTTLSFSTGQMTDLMANASTYD